MFNLFFNTAEHEADAREAYPTNEGRQWEVPTLEEPNRQAGTVV